MTNIWFFIVTLLACALFTGCASESNPPLSFAVRQTGVGDALDALRLNFPSRFAAKVGTNPGSEVSFESVSATLNGITQEISSTGPSIMLPSLSDLASVSFKNLKIRQSNPDELYTQPNLGGFDISGQGIPATLFGRGLDAQGTPSFIRLVGISSNGGLVTFSIQMDALTVSTGQVTTNVISPTTAYTTLGGAVTAQISPITISSPFQVSADILLSPVDSFGTESASTVTFHVVPTGSAIARTITFAGQTQSLVGGSVVFTVPADLHGNVPVAIGISGGVQFQFVIAIP